MAFRSTLLRRRLFGIGARDSERHREPRYMRHLDAVKLIVFVTGVMFCGVWGMKTLRAAQIALDPKGSQAGMAHRMDAVLFQRPDLAVALTKMVLHHAMCDAQTPFGAPMVAPKGLAAEADELEALVAELLEYKHDFSPADLWAFLSVKAIRLLGGPECAMRAGRPLDARSVKVALADPIVPNDERNAAKLKAEFTRRGYRVSDIVTLVGAYRSLGYHDGAKVAYDTKAMQYVDAPAAAITTEGTTASAAAPSASGEVKYRKTTTHPFVFSNDYFDELVQYQWHVEAEKKKKEGGGLLSSLFGGRKEQQPAPLSSSSAGKVYRCDDDRKAALRVKYLIRSKGPSTPMTREEAEAEAEAANKAADPASKGSEHSVCSQISMEGLDVSLLDDSLLSGWTNRYADNEQMYFVESAKLFENVLSRGYPRDSLRRVQAI